MFSSFGWSRIRLVDRLREHSGSHVGTRFDSKQRDGNTNRFRGNALANRSADPDGKPHAFLYRSLFRLAFGEMGLERGSIFKSD